MVPSGVAAHLGKEPITPMKLIRFTALVALAAGVGVAILASREDGREKLSQLGEGLGKAFETGSAMVRNGRQFASEWIENFQSGEDFSSYQPGQYSSSYQANNNQHQSEFSHTH